MLATKRSAGVTPEVYFRECTSCTLPPSVNKAVHSDFETQSRHVSTKKFKKRLTLLTTNHKNWHWLTSSQQVRYQVYFLSRTVSTIIDRFSMHIIFFFFFSGFIEGSLAATCISFILNFAVLGFWVAFMFDLGSETVQRKVLIGFFISQNLMCKFFVFGFLWLCISVHWCN